MAERTYWVICDDNCKFEGMTKEQIIAAIAEVTGKTPTDVDAAFITKIKEQNTNSPVKIWVGTQAEFNALTEKDDDTIYYYDDTDTEDLTAAIENILNGTTPVEEAKHAVKADEATHATNATNADNADSADNAVNTDFTNGEWIDGVSSSGATTTSEKYYIPRSALVMGATYEVRFYEKTSTSPSLAFNNPVGSVIFNYFTPEDKSSTQYLAYRVDYKDQTTYAGQFIEMVRNLVVNASQNRVYVVQVETAYINEISGDKVKTTKLSSSSDNKTTYYNLKYRRIR